MRADEVAERAMAVTDFHAKYLPYELTRRCASDSVE